MRVVLDTNIWLSGLLYSAESSPPRKILERLAQGDFELVTSPDLTKEFDEVLRRHGLPKPILDKWLNILKRTHLSVPPFVRHVEPAQTIDASITDPDDNRVLECAIEGKADLIVSGDKHLRDLENYRGIPILPPRDFIERLNQEK